MQFLYLILIHIQSLPMAYLTLSTVLCIVGYQCPWVLIQFGWFVSWVYLRFYKKNPGESLGGQDTYGDRSETFSLVSWFPPFMQYALLLCFLSLQLLMLAKSSCYDTWEFCILMGKSPSSHSLFVWVRRRTWRLWTAPRDGTCRG